MMLKNKALNKPNLRWSV